MQILGHEQSKVFTVKKDLLIIPSCVEYDREVLFWQYLTGEMTISVHRKVIPSTLEKVDTGTFCETVDHVASALFDWIDEKDFGPKIR